MRNKNLIKLASELSKFNEAFKLGRCRIIDEKVYNSKFLFIHYFYWSSKFYDNPYRSILIDYFEKSERMYPGSSHVLSAKLCDLIYSKPHKLEKHQNSKKFDDIMNYLSMSTSEKSFSAFRKILEFSGADATITCEKSKAAQMEVVKVCLPEFEFAIEDSFRNIYFNNVEKTTKNFIVSIVDGFIERESEIYSLIEHAKSQKLHAVLICRGISDYAKANLKKIILKNKVYIYPYIEKHNNNDPFKISDIASLAGIDVISADCADSINKDIVDKTKIIKCTVSSNKIVLNEKSEALVAQINKQIDDNKGNKDLLVYLRKRKSRCMPNNTIVRVPESDVDFLTELKNLIRCYNFCAIRGVFLDVDTLKSSQCEKITNTLSQNLYNNLSNIFLKIKIGE